MKLVGIRNFENEIVHQILMSELTFRICNDIKIIEGRGSDFIPYYYNLNFVKGLISLHSLLISQQKSELSITNYISEHKTNYPSVDIGDFEKEISRISQSFVGIFPVPLRNKIAAHIDESFTHIDFTSAYIIPKLIPDLYKVATNLKNVFFEFKNYAKDNDPYRKIRQQSDFVIKMIIEEKGA